MGEYDKAIDEIQRYLLSESYHGQEETKSEDNNNKNSKEDNHFLCYYLKGKLFIKKSDWKSGLINFNNA